jgi:mycothione reductase
MADKHYDLIVIGSGSGLNIATAAVHEYGWQVAVVEKGPMGGTCLNRGCIPSKMIIHVADLVEEIRSAANFGIEAKIEKIDFATIINRARDWVDADSARIEENINKNGKIDLYKGEGKFTASKTIQINDQTIDGERVVIAAGARPFVPPFEGLDQVKYWTSTEALRPDELPGSMIIIGGGYISAELGHFYGTLGTKVTILETADKLIAREDADISETFTRIFSTKHNVILGAKVMAVKNLDADRKAVIYTNKAGEQVQVEAEEILMTVGMRPNSDLLDLSKTQVQMNERGYIQVNEFMETTEPNVWALGDIVGKAPFKHGANYESQQIFKSLGGEKHAVDYRVMPHAIFTSPQVAGVGITEQEAVEKGISFKVLRYDYERSAMGKSIGAGEAFVKFIVDAEEEKILGCHILGPQASTLIHEVIVVMQVMDGKISAIKDTIHIHPALSEVIRRAF